MGRFSRFLHLEKDREQRAHPGVDATSERTGGAATAARFDGVQISSTNAPHGPKAAAEGHLARFEDAREHGLEVHERRAGDQPFTRCAQCHGDNSRFAQECAYCHAHLSTPEQRAYNEQLWAERLASKDAEQQARQELHTNHQQVSAQVTAEQRKLYEQMAREVREHTERRLASSPMELLSRRHLRGFGLRNGLIAGGIGLSIVVAAAWSRGGFRAVKGVLTLALFVAAIGLGRSWLRR